MSKARTPIEAMIDEATGFNHKTSNEEYEKLKKYFANLCIKSAEECEKVNPSNPFSVALHFNDLVKVAIHIRNKLLDEQSHVNVLDASELDDILKAMGIPFEKPDKLPPRMQQRQEGLK